MGFKAPGKWRLVAPSATADLLGQIAQKVNTKANEFNSLELF
jgi:hypothetical protein